MGKIREGLVHGVMLLWRDGDADAVSYTHLDVYKRQVPDGHIDRAGAVAVGQLLPLVIFEQIKGCDL